MRKRNHFKLNELEKRFLESVGDGSFVATFNSLDNKKLSFNNERIRQACTAIVLYSDTNDIDYVATTMDLSKRTIYSYIHAYKEDKNFIRILPVTNVSELQGYVEQIADNFKHHRVKTYKEAQERIREITGITRSLPQIRAFLKNNYFEKNSKGFFYQKTSKHIRLQLEERKKRIKNRSYLETNPEEVEEFAYMIAGSYNYRTDRIAKRIKEKFELRETSEEIENWIDKNTTIKITKKESIDDDFNDDADEWLSHNKFL